MALVRMVAVCRSIAHFWILSLQTQKLEQPSTALAKVTTLFTA